MLLGVGKYRLKSTAYKNGIMNHDNGMAKNGQAMV